MAKKKLNSAGTLSSYWCPPADLLADGVGEPIACIASTFEFDAAFFETELLPRFLGLRFDHTENELTFLVEREEKLALTAATVLVDIHKVDPGQTTLRWDQVPIAVPGAQSIQHSKIVLLAWERLVRLIVGSANLTRPGYRRNREVFASLDFYDNSESPPRRPASDSIRLLEQVLAWARTTDEARIRAFDSLALARDKLASWKMLASDFRPRERPKVSLIATHPAVDGQKSASAIDQVATAWGPRRVSEVTVVTPFVGMPEGEVDKVVRRLETIPRSRECVGRLIAPRHPAEESDRVIRVALPRTFGECWGRCFDSRGGSQVLAIPQYVKSVDKVNRALHSKVFSLEGGDHQLLMIGSSNFTPHGMGVGVFNVEANLLFEDPGVATWERINFALICDDWKELSEVQWDEQAEPPEDCIDHAAMLPRFFVCASYSQVTGELNVTVDHSTAEPPIWAVRLKGVGDEGLTIFQKASTPAEKPSGSGILTHTLPEGSRSASLAALLVEWVDDAGEARQARLVVSIASKDDLVASDHFKAFGVDAMIDCLVHGRSLAEWQERQLNKEALGVGLAKDLDSLRSVDTSGYLLYQVRRFGRAIAGLTERLEKTVLIPTAVRYRLFKDPLGPISLALAITNANKQTTGSFTSLSAEHRLFLLAELLLSVDRTGRRMLKRADKRTRKWLKELIDEATGVLVIQVSSRQEDLGSSVAANMGQYLTAALHEANQLINPTLTETANAR